MNKTERISVLSKSLYDTFNPQFLTLKKTLADEVKNIIPEKFIKLINDPDSAVYVDKYCVSRVILSDQHKTKMTAVEPKYTSHGDDPFINIWQSDQNFSIIKFTDIKAPHSLREPVLENVALFEMYHEVWRHYLLAHQILSELLASYRSRAKFATDFPELEKYLPPSHQPAKLPAVPVNQFKHDLAALGIPMPINSSTMEDAA